MCFFFPIRNDPRKQKTHKQNFATHPVPGQSRKFVHVDVFILSLKKKEIAKLRREKLPLSRSSGKRKLEPSWPSIKLSSKLVSWEEKLPLSTPPWGQAVKGLVPLRRLKLLFVSRAGLSSFESSGVKVLL